MSSGAQRRAIVRRDSAAQGIWVTLLVIQGLNIVGIGMLVGSVSLLGALWPGLAGLAGLAMGIGSVMLALAALVWWGIWSLAGWVRVLVWVIAILNFANLFNGQYWSGVMPILVAIGYTWLLRIADPITD